MTTTPAAPAAELNATKLRELHKAATPGPWDADTLNSEGSYGSGGDTHEGFATTAIYDADGKVLLDALNSDAILVQEEWDEDGGRAYDLTSAANASLITYLRNAVPDILALIEERDRLREALDAAHFYIDAHDSELAERGLSRDESLFTARVLREALAGDKL